MKALKKNVPEQKQLTSMILESANQIWLAGLGAFARAQEEGTKVFDTLVEAGKEIESTGKRVAEEKVDAVAGKATETWDKLEQVFQERVGELIKKEKAVAKPKVAAPVKAAGEVKPQA
jgi:poly(hydroxyalkanoate) granule-associated protein